MTGQNSLDWTKLEMCETVTQLERIHWTGQTWRSETLTEDWTKLEMCKTVTDSWKEFTGLDKPGDVRH